MARLRRQKTPPSNEKPKESKFSCMPNGHMWPGDEHPIPPNKRCFCGERTWGEPWEFYKAPKSKKKTPRRVPKQLETLHHPDGL